jgi:hypothetical protein
MAIHDTETPTLPFEIDFCFSYTLKELIDRWSQHIQKRYKHAVRYFGLSLPEL